MDFTTILGLGLLAFGFYWVTSGKKPAVDPQSQLADLINQLRPKPVEVAQEPAVVKIDRDKAIDAVEVLVDYFEQRGTAEAIEPLQSIFQLILTPTLPPTPKA